MGAVGRAGEQQAGEADRIDHRGRAGLAGEQLIVLVADRDADREVGREMARGERDQDRGVVAAGGDDHRPGAIDVDRLRASCRGSRRPGGPRSRAPRRAPAPPRSQSMTTMSAALAPRAISSSTASEPLVPKPATTMWLLKVLLESCHMPSFPCPAENEGVGRADEDQHEEDADRRHHQRVEHAGVVGHRDDVAIAGGGDADHREIDDVEEADLAVVIVPEAVALEPVDARSRRRAGRRRAPTRQPICTQIGSGLLRRSVTSSGRRGRSRIRR